MSSKRRPDERFPRSSDWCGSLTLLVILIVSGGRAAAQTEPAQSPIRDPAVQTLITQGVEFRNKGDDQAALTSFLKAYELSKEARVLAQIALAEQALGHWVDAEDHLIKALQAAEDPWIAKNRAVLEGALGEIQHHVGSLELSGGIPGAEVRLNGTLVGSFPLKGPIRTLAGSVALDVKADGYLPVIRTVIVPSGGLARESVTLVSVQPAASGQTVPQPDRPAEPGNWSTRKKAALALGVGAAGAAAAGTVFYLLYRSRSNDFNHSTDHAGARCTIADPVDNCKTLNDDINRAQILAVVGFAGAGVLLGVGSYLVLTDQPRDHGGIAVGDGKLSFRCLPSVGAALTCAGTF